MPSTSPASITSISCGWSTSAAARASRAKRRVACSSRTSPGLSTFSATTAPSSWIARKTIPIPPSPSCSSTTYAPNASPGCRVVGSGSLLSGMRARIGASRKKSPCAPGPGLGSHRRMAGRRLTAYYVVLVIAVAVVATLVLSAGAKEEPEPAIAGGYDVTQGQACLGEQIDLRQSGQFVGLRRADGSEAGKLRFKDAAPDRRRRAAASGGTRPLAGHRSRRRRHRHRRRRAAAGRVRARAAGPGGAEALAARLGGGRVQARAPLRLPRRQDRADRATAARSSSRARSVHGELVYGAAGKLTGSAVCSAGDEAEARRRRVEPRHHPHDHPRPGARGRAREREGRRPRRPASSGTCSPPSSSRSRS